MIHKATCCMLHKKIESIHGSTNPRGPFKSNSLLD